MTAHYDQDTSDQPALAIEAVLNRNDHATKQEALMATIGACGSVIGSIACKDCRQIAAENALDIFPKMIASALEFAADKFGEDPPFDHRH